MSRARGFTLIEVLVATGILVTVAAGSAQLFTLAIRHDIAARQQIAMASAASAALDAIAADVAQLPPPLQIAGSVDRVVAGYRDTTTWEGTAMERRWMIAPLPAYSTTAVAIVVRVTPLASTTAGDLEAMTIREARAR